MSLGMILLVCAVLIAVFFVIYMWNCYVISRTGDTDTLHRYEKRFLFSWVARMRLIGVYAKQLEECSTAEQAYKIRSVARSLCTALTERAYLKWGELVIEEKRREIENVRDNEEKLIEFLKEVACNPSPVRSLKCFVVETLRPFTEKRIKEAIMIKELTSLRGESGRTASSLLYFGEDMDRIDGFLEKLYAKRLMKLVLREALAASTIRDSNNLCFKIKTDNQLINKLVSTKCLLLSAPPEEISAPSMRMLLGDINLVLYIRLQQLN